MLIVGKGFLEESSYDWAIILAEAGNKIIIVKDIAV